MSVTGKRKPPEALAFDKKHRDDPRAIAKYLNGALAPRGGFRAFAIAVALRLRLML